MTFIEEITPYIDRIKLHHNGGRITNLEVLRTIRDIHFQYIRRFDFNTPANLGCNNCVKQMINQLIGKIERDSCIGKKMTFPKIEKLEVIKEYEDKPLTEEKIAELLVDMFKDPVEGFVRGELIPTDWREFQKYCRDKGLKSGGKTRKELENELKGL